MATECGGLPPTLIQPDSAASSRSVWRLLTHCSFASVASVLDENLPDY